MLGRVKGEELSKKRQLDRKLSKVQTGLQGGQEVLR